MKFLGDPFAFVTTKQLRSNYSYCCPNASKQHYDLGIPYVRKSYKQYKTCQHSKSFYIPCFFKHTELSASNKSFEASLETPSHTPVSHAQNSDYNYLRLFKQVLLIYLCPTAMQHLLLFILKKSLRDAKELR